MNTPSGSPRTLEQVRNDLDQQIQAALARRSLELSQREQRHQSLAARKSGRLPRVALMLFLFLLIFGSGAYLVQQLHQLSPDMLWAKAEPAPTPDPTPDPQPLPNVARLALDLHESK